MKRLTPQQKQDRLARRGKRARSMENDAFVPIVREVKLKEGRKLNRKQRRAGLVQIRRGMQVVGVRLVQRVRRRREMESADWLKQMRRQQRNQSEARPPRTPEQKIALAIKNEDKDALTTKAAVRYKSLPTPEQLDATRIKDARSSKR